MFPIYFSLHNQLRKLVVYKLYIALLGILMTLLPESSLICEITIPPQEALERLLAGNQRYVSGELLHPNRCQESRRSVAHAQRPFAIILGCSDSRVSPEIVFDQGIGDLFVVRVAGNVVGPLELDSIEYSTLYLNSSLILVMGHEECGAVKAVFNKNTKDIESVATLIQPAVSAAISSPTPTLEYAVKLNIEMVVDQLKRSPVLAECIKKGTLNVVGGYYHLESGKVIIIK